MCHRSRVRVQILDPSSTQAYTQGAPQKKKSKEKQRKAKRKEKGEEAQEAPVKVPAPARAREVLFEARVKVGGRLR